MHDPENPSIPKRSRRSLTAIWVSLAGVFVSGLIVGCSNSPYAASTNRIGSTCAVSPSRVLTRSEQTQIRSAFDQLASGHAAVNPPRASEGGLRWTDLELAVPAACDEAEMAIVHANKYEWGIEYQLQTIEDLPGTLRVRNTGDARVYDAEATIGHFGDRTDRAVTLLNAIDAQMRAYGKKRAIQN